jgi:hypothetical protein
MVLDRLQILDNVCLYLMVVDLYMNDIVLVFQNHMLSNMLTNPTKV